MAPAAPQPGRRLDDGTVEVAGSRGTLRLSDSRTRWWNGRIWERTADSTPWRALLDADRKRWWDGTEWQPVRRVLPVWRRPVPLVTLQLGLPLLLLAGATATGYAGLGVALFLLTHAVVFGSLVASSKVLGFGARLVCAFSLAGVAGLGLSLLWLRVTGGEPELRSIRPMPSGRA